MSRKIKRISFFFLLAVFFVACSTGSDIVNLGVGGFTVAPEFKTFYDEHGGQAVIGLPITDLVTDPIDGRQLQYFQKFILIYQPNDPQPIQVEPLGKWALSGLKELTPAAIHQSDHQELFASGFVVQDEFLTFYEDHNGAFLLGQPISEQLYEGEWRVQYFENGRLEWHPEAPLNYRVQLGLLGWAHYAQYGIHQYPAQPIDLPDIESVSLTGLVQSPILYAGDDQMLYVRATTEDGLRPVSNIRVTAMLILDSGENQIVNLGITNPDGYIIHPLTLPDIPAGQDVHIEILAYGNGAEVIGQTMTSFKTWW